MSKLTLQVAKIVASATDAAWSQAYHAGGLTALLSVTPKKISQNTPSLAIVGKDLLNTFESEYFTLETKNLECIGKAVEVTYKKSQDTHDISLIVAACIQNALYVVLAGTGNIKILRKGNLGVILAREDLQEDDHVLAASGFLENDDIIILETTTFSHLIPQDTLIDILSTNTVEKAAETFSPKIHSEQKGSEAALFFAYKEDTDQNPFKFTQSEEEKKTIMQEKESKQTEQEIVSVPPPEPALSHEVHIQKNTSKGLTHRQKIFLTITIILLIVLGATIYLSLKKAQETKQAALFSSIYQPAQQQYQEGQGLVDLNAEKARSDFQQAIATLQNGKDKFPTGSTEQQQIITLLTKVQQSLSAAADVNTISLQKIDNSTNTLLAFESKQDTQYATADTSNFYTADTNNITRYSQKTNVGKTIIKNTSDWKSIGGFGTYLGNFYLVDTQGGILKYAVTENGFGKTNYFTSGINPDLSHAVSLTIDGSLWILSSDGTILKFTKGKPDTFTLSGLDKQLHGPTHIVTSVDDNNIYVLDSGNARFVIFDKTGKYLAEYQSQQIKEAKDRTVDEKNKKADFLVGNDLYELPFK